MAEKSFSTFLGDDDEDETANAITEDIYDVPRQLLAEDDQLYANLPQKSSPIPVCLPEISPAPPPLPSKKLVHSGIPEKVGLSSVKNLEDGLKGRPTPKPRRSLQHKDCVGPKPTPLPRKHKRGSIIVKGVTITESSDQEEILEVSSLDNVYDNVPMKPPIDRELPPVPLPPSPQQRTEPVGMADPVSSVTFTSQIDEDFESSIYEKFDPCDSPYEDGLMNDVPMRETDPGIYEPVYDPYSATDPPLATFRPKSTSDQSDDHSNEGDVSMQKHKLLRQDAQECSVEQVYDEPAHVELIRSSSADQSLESSDQRIVIGAENDSSAADDSSCQERDSLYQGVWNMGSGRPTLVNSSEDLEPNSGSSSRDSPISFEEPPPSFSPPPLPAEYNAPPPPPPRNGSTSQGLGLRNSMVDFNELAMERARLPTPCSSAAASDASCTPLRPIPPPVVGPRFSDALARQPSAEANVYEAACRVVRTPSSEAPTPPPKIPNPFKEHYDSSRGTYCLEDFVEPSFDDSAVSPSWESDDTLSDGGEFFDSTDFTRPSVEQLQNLRAGIPIVPAVPSKQTSREGYLYKLSGKRSNRLGWHKRWVTFDSHVLKYYSNKTSGASRRIIPVYTMINVENDIKSADFIDSHEYRFKLTTVDRIYTFATDDRDDLLVWTSLLMQAIIDAKTDDIREGGDMCSPDKEGYVKMEGIKHKRYLVIKGENFCYYNTFNDFKACSPIHQVQMKLASIKDLGKFKLRIITPNMSYILLLENQAEINSWKVAFEEAIASGLGEDNILNEVYENHSNRFCADCGTPDPHWASVNLAITLCTNCAGIHRMLGLPLSKLMQRIGNDNANNFWEWNTSEQDRIDSDSHIEQKKDFILEKYQQKLYCRLHPLAQDQEALNEAFCKSVQYGDVLETMQLLFSGANIVCSSATFGNQSPLELAKNANQALQMEFLLQNGAETLAEVTEKKPFSASQASFKKVNKYGIKGFLYKTGSNQKGDFLRRWVVLENGNLSYYESEKAAGAKDTITRKEMLSVAITYDDRYEHAFELGTTKQSGRAYLFAADSFEERQKWIINLAKSIAPVREGALAQVKDLDRGGIVFLREGATKAWKGHWIHMKGKTLSLYDEEKDDFEEIDLRKVKSLSQIGNTRRRSRSHSINNLDDLQLRIGKSGTMSGHLAPSPSPSPSSSRSTPFFSFPSSPFLQTSDRCTDALDEGQPFVIDLPNSRALYLQGDTKKETASWYAAITKATTDSSEYLSDQQLTADNVPLIVDKCINFLATHGMESEGIYRLSGQHSVVATLLNLFKADARSVHIRLEDFNVNDVATALKRFFRSLRDPVMTQALHSKWVSAVEKSDMASRMQWYKYLLGDLALENYQTLKRVVTHLARVAENESVNKMGVKNLSAIFGPVLMSLDQQNDDAGVNGGFQDTASEIAVVRDLIENHRILFEVKETDLEQERKIDDARKRIEEAMRNTVRASQAPAGDMLIDIYVNDRSGNVINYKVPSHMTAKELVAIVTEKAHLDTSSEDKWALFEVIANGELERPLHFSENVLDVIPRWGRWPEELCRENYICIKSNYVYDKIRLVFDPHFSLFSELRYSEKSKRNWRKFAFEFSHYALRMRKDTKATNPIATWNAEDLTLYLGVQQKRNPPSKYGFTFIPREDKATGSYLGHSICCNNEEELYRWVAAILHAQHPVGLLPDGSLSPNRAELDAQVPVSMGSTTLASRAARSKQSFIQMFIKK